MVCECPVKDRKRTSARAGSVRERLICVLRRTILPYDGKVQGPRSKVQPWIAMDKSGWAAILILKESARGLAQSKSWRALDPATNTRSVLDCSPASRAALVLF